MTPTEKKSKRVMKHENEAKEVLGEMSIDEMIKNNQNKYLLVNMLASRARELNEGARSLVKLEAPATTLELAIAEGKGGLLKVEPRETEKVVVDLVDND